MKVGVPMTLSAPLDLTMHSKSGLYDPQSEHDACGVAAVATLNRKPTRKVVDQAIEALVNLNHRGAVGAEENTGDGAGILMSIPDEFLRTIPEFSLPEKGAYAVGIAFLDRDTAQCGEQQSKIAQIVSDEGLDMLGWHDVPVDPDGLGLQALATMPSFKMVAIASPDNSIQGMDLERKVFRVRKRCEHEVGIYFSSLSTRTLTYKGMLTTLQLQPFFPDLSNPLMKAKVAIVHSRFSTNTFPSWPLAQPFRLLAHNGEINTIQGNRNWMSAREGRFTSPLLGEIADLLPVNTPGYSDSGTFDESLELLHMAGRSLPHAIMMMMPPAWENDEDLDPDIRAFYEYNNSLIEPWDGPADIAFTDGIQLGAVLDRNGLRPGRWQVSDDGTVVLASEAGVLPEIGQEHIVQKGRLEPGKMFMVDTEKGCLISDSQIKQQLASEHPYAQWIKDNSLQLNDLPEREHVKYTTSSVRRRQRIFGYTEEDLKILLAPMAQTGKEPLGSMGNDAPIAVLSRKSRVLFDYFTQKFAQVTNPPLDWERERMVTSIESCIGPEPNLLDDSETHAKKIIIPQPVIDSEEMAQLKRLDRVKALNGFYQPYVVRGLYPVVGGGEALEKRLHQIFDEVDQAMLDGKNFLILSDRNSDHSWAPIPSLLLTSAIHHHLLRHHNRTQVSLAVEAGDIREVHHAALLIAYGAACVNPYLALETAEDLCHKGYVTQSVDEAVTNVKKALSTGVLKIMSKMGVSTIMSYRGAQLFEAVGLSDDVINKYFTGTISRVGGIGLDVIAHDIATNHAIAFPESKSALSHTNLEIGGQYKWRRTGEDHLNDPEAIFLLQQSTSRGDYEMFQQYTSHVNDTSHRLMTLRGLMEFDSQRPSIPLDEVEPAIEIVKRFSTGAMSYGSISQEAHETLAIAMNRLGARSNSGEGGESADRIGDPERNSRIKQIASARFGVTSDYLASATDIQIKLAQGAKPGEGGHLPGVKVPPWIAQVRHATPGVELISPPPHHDIYSIEDLAQLIHDAKNSNPTARVHVKLVSEFGVGTIAAGVAKAHADVVLISGHDGGTGAAPLNAIKHAGTPWEIGLSETQQTLILNGLRSRVVVQCDGELKTGRDIVIAALLGAEEFGFATSALVVEGCVMMRVCHLNTCPQGIATQDPQLRARFRGKPEYVMNYFMYLAEETREILAELGFHSVDEAVGHVEVLNQRPAVEQWKAQGVDISNILTQPGPIPGTVLHHTINQKHGLEKALDHQLIDDAMPALEGTSKIHISHAIRNVNRTVGTMLGYEITRRYGAQGLPDNTIDITLMGTAGQSVGAFIPRGETLRIVGEVNDYAGKGLSGGRLIVRPNPDAIFDTHQAVIGGNVLGFGATSGQMFLAGKVGERFAVRNGGATVIAEGIGDHGCEYMTGGVAVILGPTGRNFGAGFSGGDAYVLDIDTNKINADALKSGKLICEPLTDDQAAYLHNLLSNYVIDTESNFVRELLNAWDKTITRITHIIPRAYKKMSKAMVDASDQHIDFEQPGVWEDLYENVMEGAR